MFEFLRAQWNPDQRTSVLQLRDSEMHILRGDESQSERFSDRRVSQVGPVFTPTESALPKYREPEDTGWMAAGDDVGQKEAKPMKMKSRRADFDMCWAPTPVD